MFCCHLFTLTLMWEGGGWEPLFVSALTSYSKAHQHFSVLIMLGQLVKQPGHCVSHQFCHYLSRQYRTFAPPSGNYSIYTNTDHIYDAFGAAKIWFTVANICRPPPSALANQFLLADVKEQNKKNHCYWCTSMGNSQIDSSCLFYNQGLLACSSYLSCSSLSI